MKRLAVFVSALVSLFTFAPVFAYAHEVYVLTPSEIAQGMATPPFSLWDTMLSNLGSFEFWAFVGALMVFCVFLVSISRTLERKLDPFLMRIKKYAPAIARVTVGLAFLAAAYYQAIFGPELSLVNVFGSFAPLVTVLLVAVGLLFCLGVLVRPAAIIALCLFAITASKDGSYMLTYTNYFGEIILLILLGDSIAGNKRSKRNWFHWFAEKVRPYRFAILRVAFGTSLLYASLYAKVFHNVLALQVATLPFGRAHDIAYQLGFEPHFLVLGAAIVEILIGLFFLLGIEIRFTALFLEFWLTLSLLYFGEVVWPHLILIGIPIAFICHGYDKGSVEGIFFKKGKVEPVL